MSRLAQAWVTIRSWAVKAKERSAEQTAIEFLPDADEIERRPLPRNLRITVHVSALAMTSLVLWAVFSDIDSVVTAHGRLVTPLPNIVVQPLETSIILSIDVRSGQVVRKGELLATLDPTFAKADEAQLRTRLYSLNNQLLRMERELSGKTDGANFADDADSRLQARLSGERHASFEAQVRRLDETIRKLRATLETSRLDQQALASRVEVLKEMVLMQQDLVSKKYAVRSRLLEAQDRLLEAERNMELARNRQIEIRRELAALEAEKTSFETGWRQKLMEEALTISRERDSVSEQLHKADKRNKLVVLSSPVDAVVLDIAKLSQGSVAQAAEKLFTLVPLDAELEAEVQIDSVDVGYLKLGDTAHIKLDAYPFQKHGMLEGVLRTISEDSFRRETNTSSGMDAYYLSRIRLTNMQLKRMPKQAKLLPGMTLSAEIVVGKRSVMSYLLWPLTKAVSESIREP